jgi:hypothetical protein
VGLLRRRVEPILVAGRERHRLSLRVHGPFGNRIRCAYIPALKNRPFTHVGKAVSTVRAYTSDARVLQDWRGRFGFRSLPASPEAVAGFNVHEAEEGRAASTLGRRMAAIRHAHELARLPDPREDEGARAAMKGARRKIGVAPKQKASATADVLAALLMRTPDTLTFMRDWVQLALGFAGAFRRSKLVALNVEDLREDPEGLRVRVRPPVHGRSRGQRVREGDPARAVHPARRLRARMARQGWDRGGPIVPAGLQIGEGSPSWRGLD